MPRKANITLRPDYLVIVTDRFRELVRKSRALTEEAYFVEINTDLKKSGYYNLIRGQRVTYPTAREVLRALRFTLDECEKMLVSMDIHPNTHAIQPDIPLAAENSLVWLHLSDLHMYGNKTAWDTRRVLKSLITDLEVMQAQKGLKPDFLLFTGDAAFGHTGEGKGETISDQFQEAHTFFENIRTAFLPAIPRENVFLVPGNHDVNRNSVLQALIEWLDRQKNVDDVISLIQSNKRDWKLYMERLEDYRSFLEKNGYHHLLTDPSRLIYAIERNIKGIKVGLYGLNSSWSCGRNDERGKLWAAGKWQIGHLKSKLEEVDIALALIHHPGSWFVEYEEPALSLEMEREFHFHLHGHEHLGWIDQKANGHTRIAAAATYQGSEQENSYNIVRIDLQTGNGEVWLRRYDPHGGGWIPHVIHKRTDNEGRWTLQSLNLTFQNNRRLTQINDLVTYATQLRKNNTPEVTDGALILTIEGKHAYDWASVVGAAGFEMVKEGMHILYEEYALDPSYDEKMYRRNHQVRIPEHPYLVSPRGFIKLHKDDWEWLDPRDRNRRICDGVISQVLADGRVVLSGRPLILGDIVDILD